MTKQYILTLTAANRVGVLAALSNGLDELGGSFQEIGLKIVRNFFTMIIAADFPDDRDAVVIVDHLRAVCRPFEAELSLRDPASLSISEPTETAEQQRYVMTMSGRDRPGILRRVARRLAQEGIEVAELEGARQLNGGGFQARLALVAPAGFDCQRLRKELELAENEADFRVVIHHSDVEQSIR